MLAGYIATCYLCCTNLKQTTMKVQINKVVLNGSNEDCTLRIGFIAYVSNSRYNKVIAFGCNVATIAGRIETIYNLHCLNADARVTPLELLAVRNELRRKCI